MSNLGGFSFRDQISYLGFFATYENWLCEIICNCLLYTDLRGCLLRNFRLSFFSRVSLTSFTIYLVALFLSKLLSSCLLLLRFCCAFLLLCHFLFCTGWFRFNYYDPFLCSSFCSPCCCSFCQGCSLCWRKLTFFLK